MEVSKSMVLGMLICFYYPRTQKAVDCIRSQVDPGGPLKTMATDPE